MVVGWCVSFVGVLGVGLVLVHVVLIVIVIVVICVRDLSSQMNLSSFLDVIGSSFGDASVQSIWCFNVMMSSLLVHAVFSFLSHLLFRFFSHRFTEAFVGRQYLVHVRVVRPNGGHEVGSAPRTAPRQGLPIVLLSLFLFLFCLPLLPLLLLLQSVRVRENMAD